MFVSQPSATKTRIFLLGPGDGTVARTELTAVTTVNGPPESGAALRDALNVAAQTGDRSRLEQQLAGVPDAVAMSCRQALEACLDPSSNLVGAGGWPLSVIRRTFFSPASSDLHIYAEAAMDIGLAVLIENQLDEDGDVSIQATLLSDEAEIEQDQVETWWPIPDGSTLAERIRPNVDEIRDILSDSRWETHRSRAFWLWVKDESSTDELDRDHASATAEWVVEFFGQLLGPDLKHRVFEPDDGYDEEDRGFLTPRTRLLLWVSLVNISGDLELLSVDWDSWDSQVRDDMPALVRDQPRAWWTQMSRSAQRLCDAARRGTLDELEPRTPAEEALISLATRAGYVDWARDTMMDLGLGRVYDGLPTSDDDEVWEEVLGDLTGDTDIEIVWSSKWPQRADPADPTNQFLGMGDYRPRAWHRLFDRAVSRLPGVGPDAPDDGRLHRGD